VCWDTDLLAGEIANRLFEAEQQRTRELSGALAQATETCNCATFQSRQRNPLILPRTIRRWIAGHSRIPSTAVILIRALSLGDLTKEQIEQLRD